MSERRFDLLVAGELNPDAIVVAETIEPEFGQVERLVDHGVADDRLLGGDRRLRGGPARDAHGLRRRRRRRRVGALHARRAAAPRRRRRRLPGRSRAARPASPSCSAAGDDRAILTSPGAMSSLTAADVSDETARGGRPPPRLLALPADAGFATGLAELFARAHEAGASTSLDPGWDPSGRWGAGLDAALEATDVFLPERRRGLPVRRRGRARGGARALAERIDTVVVKLGAEGAIARRGDGEPRAASAPSVAGGRRAPARRQLRRRLPPRSRQRRRSLDEALRLGVACGSLSTRALGGVDAQPLLAEALEVAAALSQRGGASAAGPDRLHRRRQRRVHRDADRRHPRLSRSCARRRSRCTTSTAERLETAEGVARATAEPARRGARRSRRISTAARRSTAPTT